jgi:hypothetical protein
MRDTLDFSLGRTPLHLTRCEDGQWISSDHQHFHDIESAARAECKLHLASLDRNLDEYNDEIEMAAADAKLHSEKMMAAATSV